MLSTRIRALTAIGQYAAGGRFSGAFSSLKPSAELYGLAPASISYCRWSFRSARSCPFRIDGAADCFGHASLLEVDGRCRFRPARHRRRHRGRTWRV